MIAPETIEAAVHENSKNAAQNTPLMWSPKFISHKWTEFARYHWWH